MRKDITVVVTSCNRHDLLDRTLASFRVQETEGRVARILVAEDGSANPGAVCAAHGADWFGTGTRQGQVRLIDQAYARVDTPWNSTSKTTGNSPALVSSKKAAPCWSPIPKCCWSGFAPGTMPADTP